MEITQMRYFLEVARTQHMTASAERLHIAQPALSQAIRRLENQLGVPLFTPKGRGIVLTEYGRYLQQQLTPILDQLDRLPDELRTMAKLNSETIHLNVLAASSLVTEAIIDYRTLHPQVNFQVLQNRQSEVFDIEITTLLHRPHAGQGQQAIFPEKIGLAVPNNERYAGRSKISLRDVAEEGFISLAGSMQFRYICDRFCAQAGIQPKVIFESDNPATVRNMIGANLGVGFWPGFTWGRIDSERVRLLEIDDPPCRRDIIMTCNANKADARIVDDFFDYLKNYFEVRRTAPTAIGDTGGNTHADQ